MNRIKYLVGLLLFSYSSIAQLPNSWNKVANFGGIARDVGVSFSIDSFGYAGLGIINDSIGGYIYLTDFWQYNPYTDTWSQKANFPGQGREDEICFIIGNKAYVGLGDIEGGPARFSDIWEYNPVTDTWSQKNNFAGGIRSVATAFSIGNNGYVGLGQSDTAYTMKDFWKYDPVSDSWSQLGDFPISGILETPLFTIGNYGYAGFGFIYQTQTQTNDVWQYNSTSDTWTQLADFPGDTISGCDFSFSIGNKGYTEIFYDSIPNDYSSASHSMYFWMFNASSNTWLQKDSFSGGMRGGCASFSIGNKGYVGSGTPYYLANCVRDVWEYTPDSIATSIRDIDANSISVYPDPATDRLYISGLSDDATLTVADMTGRVCSIQVAGNQIYVSALDAGVYCLRIENNNGSSLVKKFTKL